MFELYWENEFKYRRMVVGRKYVFEVVYNFYVKVSFGYCVVV